MVWPKGVSGNPHGRASNAARDAKIDGIVAAWLVPYGYNVDSLPSARLELLRRAAGMTLRRPERKDEVRHNNTIARLISQAGLLPIREPSPLPPVSPEPDYDGWTPAKAAAVRARLDPMVDRALRKAGLK
jgi:hypothetical protein